MNTPRILERLRDPSANGAAAQLAQVLTEQFLDLPLRLLLPPGQTAARTRELLLAWCTSPEASESLERLLDRWLRQLDSSSSPLAELLGAEATTKLRALAGRPFTPDRELLARLLEREPLRQILRALLLDALIGFGRRIRTPIADNVLTRGLGGLGKRALEKTGSIGALAGSFASAVSGEAERQLERVAEEFAETAVAGAVHRLIDALSNPDKAQEQAALRLALVDGLLELSGTRLAVQLRRDDLPGAAAHAREALAAWLRREQSEAAIEHAISVTLGAELERPLREVLEDAGVLEAVRRIAPPVLHGWLLPAFNGERFGAWLTELLAG